MAWMCSASTNEALVSNLRREGLVASAMVVDALRQVDRRWFVPTEYRGVAYEDRPLPIGYGATISAPHMHAIMLDLMAPVVERWGSAAASAATTGQDAAAMSVLDIGSGSGFLTAVLAVMCDKTQPRGAWCVHGIEHIPQLQQRSVQVLREHMADRGWFAEGHERVKIVVGDGRNPTATAGMCDAYDLIHVGAAAAQVPSSYQRLLAPQGRLVIPVGPENGTQRLLVYTKHCDGSLEEVENSLVQFVPLTSREHQLTRSP